MFQKDLLKNKRILVSGGGSGLGKAMATRYLELGSEVYICGRRKSVLDETAKELMDMHGGSVKSCLLYTSPSPRDLSSSRMPSSA